MRKPLLILVILLVFLGVWNFASENLPDFLNRGGINSPKVKVLTEESVVIDTVKKVGPSVVTVVEDLPPQKTSPLIFGPFSIFETPSEVDPKPRNIGSGFIVSTDGLIVTNKHVVSDTEALYQVIGTGDKTFDVVSIYRDPLNDIAILKINPGAEKMTPLELGDSEGLQVGQFVIAIGTALGEFKNTVTTGVISGLGRGITIGSSFEGIFEELDNVIQTDAAINPGNSGGPLLNSSSQVIGVNTAVAAGSENIGFALPINVVRQTLENFNRTGQFQRPYIGIVYKTVEKGQLSGDSPKGVLIVSVIKNSPAEKAGIKIGEIITEIDDREVGERTIAQVIVSKKIGDRITVSVWAEGRARELNITLEEAPK
ncbi:MAG: Trypsin domain protein [Candidatus Levybacteria bacterium GW2011_GWA2_40_8]|nr:MAG: Trypsin domain protein [Candidatus Levybacteria bacterium GW2011_GWA2_40_8]